MGFALPIIGSIAMASEVQLVAEQLFTVFTRLQFVQACCLGTFRTLAIV